jgi:hypothetical protein
MDFHGKTHDKHLYSRRIYNRKSSDPIFIAMQENLGSFRFNANVETKPNPNKPGKYSNNSEYYSMLKEYYQGIMIRNEK